MRKTKPKSWQHEANERLWLAYVRALTLLGRSEQTILNYFKSINRLDKRVVFTAATRLDLEEFFFEQLARISKASVQNYFVSVKCFYSWLQFEGYVQTAHIFSIKVPDSDTKAPEVLNEETLKALLKTCDNTFYGLRDQAIIRLFCEPGSPRLGEMYCLQVEDVDWRNCLVKVTGKTGTRLVPYGNKTANALEKYLHARTKHKHSELGDLWLSSQGRLGYYSFRNMLVRRCKKAGIPEIHPHVLRHTSADRAMSSGVSDLDMQTLFGWSSPQMLKVYAASNRVTRAIQSAKALAIGDRI